MKISISALQLGEGAKYYHVDPRLNRAGYRAYETKVHY